MLLRSWVRNTALALSLCFASAPLHATVTPNPVPLLNPIVPGATIPGAASFNLVVTGTGFVSGSVVNWNGSPLATTFASGSKLSAAVPASDLASPSTATITVTSPAPGGGISNAQYLSVENAVSQNYFSSLDITGNADLTSSPAEGDFDNDGKLDLVVASGPNVYTLHGNGDGTFAAAHGSAGPANSVITGIHVCDINGDGKLDLIVNGKRGTAGLVATMLGNGDGTFQAPVETDYTGVASSSTVVADFNGDGIRDIALVSFGNVQVLLGNSNGTFSNGPVSSLSYVGRDGLAVGDFNGDGNLDLLISAFDPSSQGYNFVGILLGNGDGSFGSLQPVSGSGTDFVGSITAAVGDFNGDGKLDVATAIQTAGAVNQGYIFVSLGNGDGTFSVGPGVPNVTSVTTPLLVGDFNADGNLDLATGGFFYYGQGDGTFPTSNGSSGAPTFVLAGDTNNDGLLDVVDETVTVQSTNNGLTTLSALGLELQVPPLPDFKGVVGPLNTVLVPGGSVSFTITISPLYGFTGDVTLGATNLPNGISPSYSPVTVKGGNGTATVTLAAASTLALGNYSVTLSGNSGTLTHTTTIPVTVNSSVGDFGGIVEPSIQNIAQGGMAVYPITITPTGGFNGSVVLSVSGLPSGSTASFSQNPVTGGSGSSTLTIVTSNATPEPQVYTPTITGVSGILSHSRNIDLGVAPQAEVILGSVTPTSQSLSAASGGTATYGLNLSTQNNSANAALSLTVSGVPAGATASFTPASITGGAGSSNLNVTAPAGTVAPGTYNLLVTISADGAVAQETVALTVTQ
jgi:hypothetical protein